MVIESAYIYTSMSIYTSNDRVTFLWQNDFNENVDLSYLLL